MSCALGYKWFLAYLQGIETEFSRHECGGCLGFLAYLQGIETIEIQMARQETKMFLAYLQGIETRRHFQGLCPSAHVSSLPTRD